MTLIKILLTCSLATTIAFCDAQSESKINPDTTKKLAPSNSFKSLYYPGLFPRRFSSINHKVNTASQFNLGRINLKPGYADQFFLTLNYAPLITRDNYSLLTSPGFYYHYDPANPYGVRDPVEGLFLGSFDYLLGKLFPDK